MFVKNLTTLAFLVACVAALPSTHTAHEVRSSSTKWAKRDKTPQDSILSVRIGLTQQNLDKGSEYLMDVSDPTSANYAKHWTQEQVIEAFAPSPETVRSVEKWLRSAGISSSITHSDNKGWLAFDATTGEMEKLLSTEYYTYHHIEHDTITTACDEYYVPKHIQKHVDYITPGVKLLSSKKRGYNKKTSKNLLSHKHVEPPADVNDTSNCATAVTPACVAALYKIPPGTLASPNNTMGIFEEGDHYSQADLNLFYKKFTPKIPQNTAPKAAYIDGATGPVDVNDAGGESDLDFQLAYPIIWPQQTTLFQTDDDNYATGFSEPGFLNDFLDGIDGSYCTYSAYGETGNDPTLDPSYPDSSGYKGKLQCGVFKPTNVVSVSYGEQEGDLPYYYQQRQCNEYMKLGLQGHSILFASGDDGVAGPSGCLKNGDVFSPAFPNSCPYLTNVGATKIDAGKGVNDPETAANNPSESYTSGGGFSNIYGIPSYQQKALDTYFANHKPSYPSYSGLGNATIGANGGLYNRGGRGYPDVAANGQTIAIYNAGQYTTEDGTSASTPIFAAIINRINEERIAVGKNPVGFVNPALYANPQILNDITSGSNPGCGSNGFSAVSGWDPVTGLGTPNYPAMLKFFLSLP